MDKKRIPIGFDDYKTVILSDYYYVDKTLLIQDLIDNLSQVNLFARPRRFGKSLNLSMLKYFFEKPVNGNSNKGLFEGKKINKTNERYLQYQEQYPVIHLSLKCAKQPNYELAYSMLKGEIAGEYRRHQYMLDTLNINDRNIFEKILAEKAEDVYWYKSLELLSGYLEQYHKKKTIILIDEYDMPLENAYYAGFYDDMIAFMRSLFESSLKTNPSLEFSVITGCLRISKESIFTGLNNLNIISITDTTYREYFGFAQNEVDEMLEYYGVSDKRKIVKNWYDGYVFGKTEVYNPWSVINYVQTAKADPEVLPKEFWSNTSSNSIIRDLIYRADSKTKSEIEQLIAGKSITKAVYEDITYKDIYTTVDNLWNFLLYTGYLKLEQIFMENNVRYATMVIPNIEVRNIYNSKIYEWFQKDIQEKDLSVLYKAILCGDALILQKELSILLFHTISYMDSAEVFYHGFILGILQNIKNYIIVANRESGEGRYNICMKGADIEKPAIVLEFKVSKKVGELSSACDDALKQIENKKYKSTLVEEGYQTAIYIGIGFWRKRCMVKCRQIAFE